AHAAIDDILASGRTPVVVGGTGLYLRAALGELRLPPAAAPGARERLERLYDRVGSERAHELLAERDPGAAAVVHPNDRRRAVRALELAEAGAALRPPQDRVRAGAPRQPRPSVRLDAREGFRALSSSTRLGLGARSGMRCAKWHGLGNDCMLVEPAALDVPLRPENVKRICDYHFGVGSDGILEVVSADGDTAEVV